MLDTAQVQAIKAAVQADPTANAALQVGNMAVVRDWLNGDSGKVCWKSSLGQGEIAKALVAGAAQVDDLTPGKRDTLFFLAQHGGMVDARLADTHSAFTNLTQGGAQTATTVRSALQTNARRVMRRWEDVFDSGLLNGANVTTLEGELPQDEVNRLNNV